MRWLIRFATGLVVVCLFVIGAGYFWLRTSLPAQNEEVTLAGLSAPVEILRDENWVPHIYARTEEDAALALGYVHAQDRLWQMETMRRLGAGRLSEIFGPSLLATDRHIRTLGLYELAKAQSAHAAEPVKRLLEAYANGVNGWLGNRNGALPPEFIALSVEPEPWDVADSLVWGPLMAWRLGTNRHDELLRARLSRHLSIEQIAELWPSHAEDGLFTVAPHVELAPHVALNRELSSNGILAGGDPIPPRAGASNIWALAGSRTVSGKPLLANDPHLPFSVPGTWYLARIVTPDHELSGATSAGLPFVVLGHNRHIAWGMTTATADVEDYFVEAVDPEDTTRYRAPGDRWEQFKTRRELIRVRGADNVELIVRETRHGPVISDAMAGAVPLPVDIDGKGGSDPVLAFAASYLRPDSRTANAMYALNRARTWDEFVAALANYDITPQNIFYADVGGNIGFVMPGLVPIRRSGKGLMPTAGWTGDTDWTGFIPYDQLPRVFNPPEGTLLNANNKMLSENYSVFISADWEEPYRAQRIADLLATDTLMDADKMSAMQNDILSLMAQHLLPKMLASLPDDIPLPEAAQGLVSWSGEMDRHRPEPVLFEAWVREFNRAVYADELGELFGFYWSHRPLFLKFVLNEGQRWCNDVSTEVQETCAEMLAQSLDAAVQMLENNLGSADNWRWGDVHEAQLKHDFFNRIPLVSHFANRRIAADGGAYTLKRVANFLGSAEQPFAGVHGAGYRAVYDLSDLAASRFMIVPGQSGNLLSSFYDDLLKTWRDGGWIQMEPDRDSLRRHAKARLLLLPSESRH
jgi:penicillin G amidase